MDGIVSVKEAEWQPSVRKEYRLWEMLVFGQEIGHRVYGGTEEEATAAAKGKFADLIGQVVRVESQLSAMEYDEEEY